MKVFGLLMIKGVVVDIKPYNPFGDDFYDVINAQHSLSKLEIIDYIARANNIVAYVTIATLPGTDIPAINWDKDIVLHELRIL